MPKPEKPAAVQLLRRLVAALRLNLRVVCEESAGRGLIDYHDYPDTADGEPWHFLRLTCARCGKRFTI